MEVASVICYSFITMTTLPQGPALLKLKKTAIQAAQAAGAVLRQWFGQPLAMREKPTGGLVSQADLEAEATALAILRQDFPEFGIFSEESPPVAGAGLGRFVLDPLDGTTNFLYGFPHFCVSLAVEWQSQPVVGVIYHPLSQNTYCAVLGEGAYLNEQKLTISSRNRLEQAFFMSSRSLSPARACRRMGSAALELAYLAQGISDGYFEEGVKYWDVAAGLLLVQEAGGLTECTSLNPAVAISDPMAESFRVLAANPHLFNSLKTAFF